MLEVWNPPTSARPYLVVLGQLPLGLAGLGLQGVLGGLVTFLQTNTDLIARSHGEKLSEIDFSL